MTVAEPLLTIQDLCVSFRTRSESVRAVDQVSLDVYPGGTLGVVGESGSGKSVTMLSVMQLLPKTARLVTSGLLGSLPQTTGQQSRLRPIPGSPPDMANVPPGCPFRPRCLLTRGREICHTELPELAPVADNSHHAACHFSCEVAKQAPAMLAAAEQIE